MAIHVLFEDDQVLALDKAAGDIVIPGRGVAEGVPLVEQAEKHAGKKVFVIHRLDKDASGLLLFAKNPAAHRALSLQFERRTVQKKYQVLVQGPLGSAGQINQPLRLFGSGRMGVHPNGKPSITDYAILRTLKGATLLDVMPRSGRRHQIRVHFYSIGHPVMGDRLYGTDRPVGGAARLMLHASALDLTHPHGRPLSLRCEPPTDFQEVLSRL